ncbi:MAG: hypothetical protein KIS30_02925 [Thermoplasmata archaeon]|nr:hypothetical protein [Candidatus Sysuiplasma acidicola]MBX8645696.1 hypothetical protein [Candidatus Sysuiplasma acidicola]
MRGRTSGNTRRAVRKYPEMLIENCETEYSDWLMAEYAHCKEIWPNLTYTNVQNPVMKTSIAALGKTVGSDAVEYTGGRGCIILDHQADRELTRAELFTHSYVIVGGILGHDRPSGRTRKYITSRFNPKRNITRNLGKKQMTIDSAVFVARALLLGASLDELEITEEVEIKWDDVHSTQLPYGYPMVEEKVIITPGLLEILKRDWSAMTR